MSGALLYVPAGALASTGATGGALVPLAAGAALVGGGAWALTSVYRAGAARLLALKALRDRIQQGGEQVAGNPWTQWLAYRLPQLAEEGLSSEQAHDQARREYRSIYKGESAEPSRSDLDADGIPDAVDETPLGGPRQSRMRGVSPEIAHLSLEVPYVLEADPDIAAAWDVAVGVLEHLREQAQGPDAGEAAIARAESAHQRARGYGNAGDTAEVRLGRAVGEAMTLVMVRQGMTPEEWTQLLPLEVAAAARARAKRRTGLNGSGNPNGGAQGGGFFGLFDDEDDPDPGDERTFLEQALDVGQQSLNFAEQILGEPPTSIKQ